jgi:uncharacterized integral membrane protein
MADHELTPPGKPAPTAAGLKAPPSGPGVGTVVKTILWVALAGAVLVLVLLNRRPVDIDLALRTVTMPLVVVMVACCLLAGALLGAGAVALLGRRRTRRRAAVPMRRGGRR